ncbi:zeta toxin family protein [Luteolibacter yonseiensis]|uniref:Zeta toxin family protein n=1 Tax=Luteolibacter yonseiensis TaxID=1144680 RepID=A0A934QWP3_9BACT|nr:zeta toxin family protein [Luteolibacter yonseiensis]
MPTSLLGVYLNPDEVEAEIRASGGLDLTALKVDVTASEVLSFFADSVFLKSQNLEDQAKSLRFVDGRLDFSAVEVNSYLASVTVDFLRQWYLRKRVSFTFESVMSHAGKIRLLADAQESGYRTYLYYVATADPEINISRVHNRVALGGHAVPESKIVSRYHRSLDLLMDAIKQTNRAYIFDNSTDNPAGNHTWLAEITDGRTMELKTDLIPSWFNKAVLDKIR